MHMHNLEGLRPRAHCALQVPTSRGGPRRHIRVSTLPGGGRAGATERPRAYCLPPWVRYEPCSLPRYPNTLPPIGVESQGSPHARPKRPFPFKTVEEMVAGLSTDPLPAGWPVRLTYGISRPTVASLPRCPGANASEGDTATEVEHTEHDISARLASMGSAVQAAALDAALEAKVARVDVEHAARPEHPTFQNNCRSERRDKVGLGVTKSRSRGQSAFAMAVSPDGACARYPVVKVGIGLVSVSGTSCSGLSKDAMADAFRDHPTVEL